jgi:hypothetical protein
MIDKHREPFFALIAGVYAFYDKSFSEFAGAVWWEAMKPFDLPAVKDALNRHCINPDVGQFMPKPADVVRMLQGSTQDAGLVAWAMVDKAVRQIGTYRSVVFDDPLTHRIVSDMGGWVALGMKTEEEWPFVRNEFVNRYRGYRGRSEVPEYPPVLIGISQSANSREGFAAEPPMLIGDQARAMQVMQLGSAKPLLEVGRADSQASTRALQLIHARAHGIA